MLRQENIILTSHPLRNYDTQPRQTNLQTDSMGQREVTLSTTIQNILVEWMSPSHTHTGPKPNPQVSPVFVGIPAVHVCAPQAQ